MKNMKKIFCIIAILLLISGFAQATITQPDTQSSVRSSEWVIMYYLNGDNVLSAIQGQTLEELRLAGSTSDVQLAVLIDQNGEGDTRLYYIVANTLVQQSWEDESSMDDADTIVQFVNQVKTDYSSDHYALILSSNKGTGWQGICWDDHGDGIMITMPELLVALNDITNAGTNKLDIFGIETCMTGNLEVAYQIRSCCDYFVAYPECAMAGDWPYSEPIADLIANPSMTPEELAITMVGYFVPQNYPSYNMITTMSAVNLSYLDMLAANFDDLAQLFIDDLDDFEGDIETALLNTRIYALFWDITYFVDPYHFLTLLDIIDPDVLAAKTAILNTIDNMVLACARLPDDDAYGISFYFPRVNTDYNNSLRYDELPSPYEETQYAIDTQWDEFLKTYLGIYENMAPNTPLIDGSTQGKAGVEYDYTVSAIDLDGDDVYYYIKWGDGNVEEWIGPYTSGEEVVFSHIWAEKGAYTIQVKAKDGLGAESDWATLEVTMPKLKTLLFSNPWSILLGKFSNFEENPEGDFRFLPVKLLHISYNEEQGLHMEFLDELYGAFPCCGYIHLEDFYGKVRKSFIRGLWIIR